MGIELKFVARSCPLCDSTEASVFAEADIRPDELTESAFASRKLPEYMHHRMVRCLCCDILYANPVLDTSVLGAAYKEAAFDSQLESRLAAVTYRNLLQPKLKGINAGNALDIGAGDGAFVEQLLSLGFRNVTGVEPSDAPIAAASAPIQRLLRHDLFRASDYEAQSFDLVTCFQVMEHVPDPLQMTKEVLSLLRTGGMFFIVVHNSDAFSARLLKTKSPIFDIEHLQIFNHKAARNLMQRAGFADISSCAIWNRYPAAYWIKLFPFPAAMKAKLMNLASSSGLGQLKISIPPGNLAVFGYKH